MRCDQKIIGCPVRRKERDRRSPYRAEADFLATGTAIFGPKNELLLQPIEITFWPAVVMTAPELDDFLGRKLRPERGPIVLGPVLCELVAAMLRHKQPPASINREPLSVTDARCITLRSRELLIGLVSIVDPCAAAGVLLRARHSA